MILLPSLALQLPFCSTVTPQDNFDYPEITAQSPTFHNIKTASIYIFDPNLKYLRPRFPGDGRRRYPQISKKIVNSILALKLQPRLFFARLCFDPSSTLASHSGDIGTNDASSLLSSCTLRSSLTPASTRFYRQSYTVGHIHCSHHGNDITAAQWTKFWSLPMFSSARNLWFRAVHRNLPTSQRLHELIPEYRATNICQLCHITIDNPSHF